MASPEARSAFAEHVDVQRARLGFRVIAWVVMPDHAHLILVPEGGVLGPTLRALKQGFGQRIIRAWRDRGDPVLARITDPRGAPRFWQRGGGYDRNVRDGGELREKIRYIHNNPTRRGLVERDTDRAWSSARDFDGGIGPVNLWKNWT